MFVDLGLAGGLLLVGVLLRARVTLLQRLFLPASVIGGFLALALGPNGGGWLPLSAKVGSHPGILITLVFAALPFGAAAATAGAWSGRLSRLWSLSTIAILTQWGVGVALVLTVLQPVWPDLPVGFGALIAVGFVGGHGTAAAVGPIFAELGWPEAGPLAMTSATVGILAAIVGGMGWVAWGSRNGQARYVTRFAELPAPLRTGLVPPDERQPVGRATMSSGAIDHLALHLALIAVAALAGWYLSGWARAWLPAARPPAFCLAFVVAFGLRRVLRTTGALHYIDAPTTQHLSAALTDLLVVFGIASIRIEVLVDHAGPLALLLLLAGIGLCGVLFALVGPRVLRDPWFERGLFTWGWITGVTAMGIALLRIVDLRQESEALADFGVVYLFVAPVEIGLLAAAPALLVDGHGGWLAAATLAAAVLLTGLSQRRGTP